MKPVSVTIPTAATTNLPPAVPNTTALLPVTANVAPEVIQLNVQGQNFETAYQTQLANALQTVKSDLVLQLLLHSTTTQLQGALMILGDKRLEAVPQALISPQRLNSNELTQLQQLAQRPQGYPLPLAKFSKGALTFTEGPSVAFRPSSPLPEGLYAVKIIKNDAGLALQLQPVKNQFTVPLVTNTAVKAPVINLQQPIAAPGTNYVVVAQNDLANTTNAWLNRLEKLPWPPQLSPSPAATPSAATSAAPTPTPSNVQSTAVSPQQSAANTATQVSETVNNKVAPLADSNTSANNKSTDTTSTAPTTPIKTGATAVSSAANVSAQSIAPNRPVSNQTLGSSPTPQQATATSNTTSAEIDSAQILQKHLTKMGVAANVATEAVALPKHNLATALMRVLPALSPVLMSDLSDPDILQQQLISALTFQPAQPVNAAPITQSDSVALMFQLLLGAKNFTAVSDKMSARLKNYLSALQGASGINGKLLDALDNSKSMDSMGHLVSSLRLFQHSSSELSNNGFFFALPYQLNNHAEQLEGHFEYQAKDQDNNPTSGWNLKLKFSLASGAMLVKAFVQGKSLRLELASNSELLLNRVKLFEKPLADKLSQVGFNIEKVNSYMSSVPATVLPGDHVLVKIKV